MKEVKLPKISPIELKERLPPIETVSDTWKKEKFKNHFGINVENEESIKSYEDLISIFNKKERDPSVLLQLYEDEMENMGLNNLEDILSAIENGKLDLTRYDTYTMNLLLNKMKRLQKNKPLENYGILTMEDFYSHVISGKLNISDYAEEEIDLLLKEILKKENI